MARTNEEEGESPRAAAKRGQILAAAQSLFLANGFESTSMDAITAAAGISKRTLYKYYPSKEDLLGDMVNQMTVGRRDGPPVRPEETAINTRDDLEEVLFTVASGIVANHRRSPYLNLVRIVIAEGARHPGLIPPILNGVMRPGMRYIGSLIDHARQSGVVKTKETDAVVRLFMGAIIMSSYESAFFSVGEPHWLTPDEIRAQVKLLVAAIT